MIDLAGRRVLVTGGSRGIGAACCRLFAEAGAAVAVHYRRDEASAAGVVRDLEGLADAPHLALRGDVGERADVERILAAVEEAWGRLDVLVNNAGIWVADRLDDFDPEVARETWRVNVDGPFLCTARAAELLAASTDGAVVNISSTAGQRGEAGYSPYAASKAAMIAATKSWAVELAPKVRVNAVAPGWVDTDMCAEPFAGGGREEIEKTIPRGRVATPGEIAGPVVFLASSWARHVTGEVLNVNGGSVLCG